MTTLALLGLGAAGALAGTLGAVLGIGGGVFLVPSLVLFFDVPIHNAVATGLVAVIATSSAVASINIERGWANLRLGMVLELATVAGALAGAYFAALLPARALIGLFGCLMAVVSVLLWRGRDGSDVPTPATPAVGRLDSEYFDPASQSKVSYHVRRLPLGLGVSGVAGALSGMLGVGGGIFKVPVLHLFCGIPMKAAAATSNFMIGVTAAASAFLYFRRGDVDAVVTAAVVLGVLLGSIAGTRANERLKEANVRRCFAALLVVLAVQMSRRAWHG